MPINTIETAKIFQKTLDLKTVQEATTGWMDANAGQVIYNGGAEVKVPKMSVDGLGDYDRDLGYPQGGVSLEYETRTMTQDRGRKFQLDAMDVDESNFIAVAGGVMSQFQSENVTPEVDVYRLSCLAQVAIKKGNVEYGYTPVEGTILRKVKEAIKNVKKGGYAGTVMVHITPDAMMELETAMAGKLRDTTFSKGGIDTTVPSIDGCPLIETTSERMQTVININDGKTEGQKQGGYTISESSQECNFIAVAKTAPIAITKQDKMKIHTPDQNQDADAWKMTYRRFHDVWVLDNQEDKVFVNIKQAKA